MSRDASDNGPQQHGGLRPAELRLLGLRPEAVIDFSASINPLGTSPRALAALSDVDYSRYPDPACTELRAALAGHTGVDPNWILAGNGATELLHLAARVFIRLGGRPIVFAPTFGEFQRAVELAGGNVFPWHASEERGFRWTLSNKPGVLRRTPAPLVYLCNPNNPTGIYVSERDVQSLAAALTGGPLLLDESYLPFVDEPWDATPLVEDGRVLLLRSMTKDYGLAGLRLGYLIAPPDVIAAVRHLQPEWSVSAAAQAAGAAALTDTRHLEAGRAAVREARAYFAAALSDLGIPVQVGAANFVLFKTGRATAVRTALLRQGLAVRDCTSFGLPEHIRVAARPMPDCRKLIAALPRALKEAAG